MWTNIKTKVKINSLNLTVIFSIFLFIVYSIWIRKMPSPYYPDELGYWGNAAYMVGIDWSRVISKLPYYGYGYSIFLSPFFLLKDSKMIYEGAIILNIFFLEGTYFIIIRILNHMFSVEKKNENIVCAFIGCLYCSYIVYSHMAMAETCILFFFTLLIMLAQKYIEMPKKVYSVVIALLVFELLAIHLRNIIFIAVTLIFMIISLLYKKRNILNYAIMLLLVGSAIALALIGKHYIIAHVYTDVTTNTHIDVNDNISSRLWFISQLLSPEWWKNYFINVLCKCFYLILSSLFTIIIAIVGLLKSIRTSSNASGKIFLLFLIALLTCSILFCSLAMYAGDEFRIDMLPYGRYVECIMPLFCAIGLKYFFEMRKETVKLFPLIAIVVLLSSQIALWYYQNNNIVSSYSNILPLQIVGLSWLLKDKPENIIQVITLLAVLVYLLITLFVYIISQNDKVSIVIIGISWIIIAYTSWNAFGLNLNQTTNISSLSRVQRMEKINEIADYIKQLQCDEVYYVFNSDSQNPDFYDMFTLQYDLVTVKIVPISGNEISKKSEDSIIVVNYCSEYFNEIGSSDELMYKNDLFVVVKGCN